MQALDKWNGQKIVILGAARQGIALARFFARQGASVILNDMKPASDMNDGLVETLDETSDSIRGVFGGHPLEILQGADLVCVSGGVPLNINIVEEALRRSIPISNDSEIFMQVTPCRVIGITGSAGKTTTTTLVGRIAEAAAGKSSNPEGAASESSHQFQGRAEKVWIGGNIGAPLISMVDQMRSEDLAVMELSSFQLELMNHSPQVAAVLNITPNHLDRHGTMKAYSAAKSRILAYQGQQDVAVLNREDQGSWSLADQVNGSLVTFGLEKPPENWLGTYFQDDELFYWNGNAEIRLMSKDQISLRGDHNLANTSAACAIAAAADLSAAAMKSGITGFHGVPHRLEYVSSWRGADWYNDSIATAPERATAAIRSFNEPIILLAGGKDKDLPWDEFARVVRKRVDHLILFGELVEKISEALDSEAAARPASSRKPLTITRCTRLEEAVTAAAKLVRPGDVVLLAPGGTSFDEFRDFEERGECFKRLVRQL